MYSMTRSLISESLVVQHHRSIDTDWIGKPGNSCQTSGRQFIIYWHQDHEMYWIFWRTFVLSITWAWAVAIAPFIYLYSSGESFWQREWQRVILTSHFNIKNDLMIVYSDDRNPFSQKYTKYYRLPGNWTNSITAIFFFNNRIMIHNIGSKLLKNDRAGHKKHEC